MNLIQCKLQTNQLIVNSIFIVIIRINLERKENFVFFFSVISKKKIIHLKSIDKSIIINQENCRNDEGSKCCN